MNTELGTILSRDSSPLLRMWQVSASSGKRALQKHFHIRFEIMKVEEGHGIYTVGKKEYPIEKGDIFVFSCNEEHCITDSRDLVIVNLHFEPRYLWGWSHDSLSEESIGICFAHSKSFENRIECKKAGELTMLFNSIKKELTERESEYSLTVKSLLNLFLVRLIRDFGYADRTESMSRKNLHSVRRVTSYIDEHLTEELTLSVLAGVAGMTPNYLSALFRKISGIPLWDYIGSKRIDRAVRLISEGDMSILEVALQCGYNNTANFNKTFKRITGMTPTQYIKSEHIS